MNQELREELELVSGWDIPKCDVLSWLLRNLPVNQKRYNGHMSKAIIGLQLIRRGSAFSESDYWEASYWHSPRLYEWAETVEDAAAKLAIQLFKQGILKREVGDAN